jgi:hypothetical protein
MITASEGFLFCTGYAKILLGLSHEEVILMSRSMNRYCDDLIQPAVQKVFVGSKNLTTYVQPDMAIT